MFCLPFIFASMFFIDSFAVADGWEKFCNQAARSVILLLKKFLFKILARGYKMKS